jgi:hypothetical protein
MRRIAILHGRFGLGGAVALAALIAYAISIGPACRLATHGFLSVSQIATAYRPLLWLDFHSPPGLQAVLTRYSDLFGGQDKLDAAREEPVWGDYAVGPVVDLWCWYRKRNRRPEFPDEPKLSRQVFHELCASDLIADVVRDSVAPDTWDEVGGRGHAIPDGKTGTLRVFQTRRVQVEVAAKIEELRRIHRENLYRQNFDLISLIRIQSSAGPDLLWELKSHALIIDRNRDGTWEFDGEPVADVDALFVRLKREARDIFEMGIYVPLNAGTLPPTDFDRLVTFCRSNDVDLFVFDRETYDRPIFGTPLIRALWIVKRRDSFYAVASAPARRE